MSTETIPLHDFSKDDSSSIPFHYIALGKKADYNTAVPHRHNYYEIFIFTKGGGIHEIDFKSYEIQSNSIHFVSPGQVHQVNRSKNSSGHVIIFSRAFYIGASADKVALFDLPFLHNYGANPVLNLSEKDAQNFYQVLALIEIESKDQLNNQRDIIRSYLNVILLKAFHVYQKTNNTLLPVNAELYKQFHLLLETSFTSLHKVKQYAEKLNTTEKKLNQSIKQHTGKTASEHIFERIILEAKRLLLHSQQSTKEIAYFLGFDDPSHFSKFFKKYVLSSPIEFRQSS